MRFSPDQLLVFATVFEHGSVTRAARELRVSQPAVSSRLRTLQALAGRQLYVRTPRGVELTAAGEALLPHARAVARALDRAVHAIELPDASAVQASIALSEAAVPLVAPRLARAALAPPPLQLRVVPCDASTAVGAVIAGEVDAAVAVAGPEPPADDLVRRPLVVDEIVLVRRGRHEPAAPLETVASLTLLWQARGSGVRATAERVLEAAGVWPERAVEIGSSLGVLAATAAGFGASLLPRRYVEPWLALGGISVTLLDARDLYARFEWIAPPLEHLSAGVQRLHDALRGGPGVELG
jgi:DNA-binding transcriptional LysR family regulator